MEGKFHWESIQVSHLKSSQKNEATLKITNEENQLKDFIQISLLLLFKLITVYQNDIVYYMLIIYSHSEMKVIIKMLLEFVVSLPA